jgi:hypothetical protein
MMRLLLHELGEIAQFFGYRPFHFFQIMYASNVSSDGVVDGLQRDEQQT